MKTSRNLLSVLIQAMFLLVVLNSCDRQRDAVTPRDKNVGARSGFEPDLKPQWLECPDGYHYDSSIHDCVPDNQPQDCSQINNIHSRERDRAVAAYGADGGYVFDQISSANTPTYSQQVLTYLSRMKNAVEQAGREYADSFGSCNDCTSTYDSNVLLDKITNHINPVKNDITNDGSLNDTERTGLLGSIQAIYDNFSEIGALVEGHTDCFPNPSWYGTNSITGPRLDGFFPGLVKVLKKVVQIVVTVVGNVIDYAMLGAVGGFVLSGGQPAGTAFGLVVGAFYGLVRGIVRSANGQYSCIVGICP